MSEPEREAYGPRGDAQRHRAGDDLAAGLAALGAAPRDVGRLVGIVRRLASGERETPGRVHLSIDEGLPGDGWSRRPPRDPEAQLAVMRNDVAELIANGQPVSLFGDNLFVDLDLSAENLPEGTRIRVGGAELVMTGEPHNGCSKFKTRFGQDALLLVQAKPTRHLNLRGVYWKVVAAGEIAPGDAVRVLSRP